MNYIEVQDPSGEKVYLHYTDTMGTGPTAVFVHGWPASCQMWESQIIGLATHGIRCVAYDRRGFGKSSHPFNGYDYTTMAEDLRQVITSLDLKDVILIGFSMGGGEIARYFAKYGNDRIKKVVLVSSVLPFLCKTDTNPDGVDSSVFDGIMEQMQEDRYKFLSSFGKSFFGVSLISHPVSDQMLQHYANIGGMSSARAMEECAKAFAMTDFREDVKTINVPTLIIHGDADKTVPIDNSSRRTAELIPQSEFEVYEGAPHGLFYTEREKLNKDLMDFINGSYEIANTGNSPISESVETNVITGTTYHSNS